MRTQASESYRNRGIQKASLPPWMVLMPRVAFRYRLRRSAIHRRGPATARGWLGGFEFVPERQEAVMDPAARQWPAAEPALFAKGDEYASRRIRTPSSSSPAVRVSPHPGYAQG